MKISFITTVLNEEKTITGLLNSLAEQTRKPEEIVICDGGSRDKTTGIVENYINTDSGQARMTMKIRKLVQNDGRKINRARGRNEAIKKANGEIIAVSDAGCILDKRWLEEITKPFTKSTNGFIRPPLAETPPLAGAREWPLDNRADVAAGFYQPLTKTVFEKCLSCYTSVMPDRLDKENFLPSSRSMAFKKSAWEKVGGYPEKFDYCEDLIFDKKLKEAGFKFATAFDAVVYWEQRKNLKEAFWQFFHYAYGDGQARYRPHLKKIGLVFLRYAGGLIISFISIISKINEQISSINFALLIISFIGIYSLWAIGKNYRYVNNRRAFFWLPILQITADLAVMAGIIWGFKKKGVLHD